MNLAAKSTRQGQGVGRDLVNKVCIDAAKNGVMKILLEISPNNLIARQLYESEGFLVFGRRNNYYRSCNRAEDTFVMERVLDPASAMIK